MSQALRIQPAPRISAAAEPLALRYDDIERLAHSIAKSGLFGIKTPDQAVVLMMIAQAEGRHPVEAARDYDVIQGKPAKKAEAMLRDFLSAGGKVEWHALTDAIADATFSHPMGGTARITWDLPRAVTAGLAGKDLWKKFPRQMLRSRTVSEGVRTIWPMATGGLYVPEEQQDIPPEPHRGPTLEAKPEPEQSHRTAPLAESTPPPATNGNGPRPYESVVWLDNLGQKLATATRDEVVKIGGLASVTEALRDAPERVRQAVTDLLADAYERCEREEAELEAEVSAAEEMGEPTANDEDARADLILAEIQIARDARTVQTIMTRMTTAALTDRWHRDGRADLVERVAGAAEAKAAELRLGAG